MKLVENPGSETADNPEALVDKIDDDITLTVSSYEIKIGIAKLPKGGSVTVQYGTTSKPVTVSTEAGEAEFVGYYRSGKVGTSKQNLAEFRAGEETITVDNVADGSGTATISPTPVRAGSVTSNKITVRFTAAGTMEGGQVRLEIPNDWGDIQRNDDAEPNYMDITVSGGTLADEIYGDDVAIAYLDDFEEGDIVIFTYGGTGGERGAQAQTNVGIAPFVISSAGSGNGSPTPLIGEDRPKD